MIDLPPWLGLVCPTCGGDVHRDDPGYRCASGHAFPAPHGIPWLFAPDLPPPTEAYARWIHDYYRVPFSDRQRRKTERLVAEFLRFTGPCPPVLDVGCGRADKARLFPPGAYIGVDPIDPVAAGMIDAPSAPMVCARGERLPFASGQFGSVMLFSVIDHVGDRAALFAEAARVLRPGGRLCLLNQVVAERGSTVRGALDWIARALGSRDARGLLAVARFTLLDPGARRYLRPLTAQRIADELAADFGEVRTRVLEGHVLLVRATR